MCIFIKLYKQATFKIIVNNSYNNSLLLLLRLKVNIALKHTSNINNEGGEIITQ